MAGSLVVGVLVTSPATARRLLKLLEPGRRQVQRDGVLADDLVEVVDALARFAGGPGGAVETRWATTTEAAAVLDCSDRNVRKLAAAGRLGSRRVRGRVEVDLDDVLARADELRNSPELSGTDAETAAAS